MPFRKRLEAAVLGSLLLALSAIPLSAHAPLILLRPGQYFNFVAKPGENPPSQVLTLANGTHGRMPWIASGGADWLTIFPKSGTLPGIVERETVDLTISADSSRLAAGAYYTTITIAAPGDTPPCNPCSPPASNTPQIVEVVLTVTTSGQAAPGIGISPPSLEFNGTTGTDRSFSQTIGIRNLGGGTLNWTAKAETSSGGNWLSVTPVLSTTANVTVRSGDLKSGTYRGQIRIDARDAANSPKFISVFFTLSEAPPVIRLTTTLLTFSTQTDLGNPPSQTLNISNDGGGALNWQATVTAFNGGPWLSVSPSSGSGAATLTVAAEVGALPAGTYTGQITITAENAVPVRVGVAFTVQPPHPIFDSSGVVNAASFLPGRLAPGQLASIFGSRLGPADPVVFTLDPATQKVPTTLAGTTVTFDGVAAPLFFVSNNQVNLQVPFEIAGQTSARMAVKIDGLGAAEIDVLVREAAPGIFTTGTRAAALNQDSTLNTPENPAATGSVIQLFLTGQGLLDTKVETGALTPSSPPFPKPVLPVTVNVGGFDANVLFAGLAPGFVGLTQINVEIPRGAGPASRARVVVGFGSNYTGTTPTIAVR